MRKGKKKVNVTVMLAAATVVLLIALIAVAAMSHKKITAVQEDSADVQAELTSQIQQNMRSGYVALADIKQGDLLVEGVNVSFNTQIVSNADASLFATSDVIGKEALLDISIGIPIFNTMIAEELPGRFTEKECTFIHLSANLLEGDYVDIRILFPNGEDYIVAAKKAIKKPIVSNNLAYFWLTEEEIDSLDAAVVDANLHKAKIYTVKYIRPEVQAANIATYQPNDDVIQLMNSNPNIVAESARVLSVTARADLEQRLLIFEDAYPEFEYNDEIGDNSISDVLTQQAGAVGDAATGTPGNSSTPGTPGTDTPSGSGTPGTDNNQSVTYGN